MIENQTGHPLIKYFQKCSDDRGKIFLHSSNDEQVANNIDAFFARGKGIDFGKVCIDYYLDHHKDLAVTLYDFVRQLTDITFAVQALQEDKENIEYIMKRTKERMEGLD